MNTNPLKRHFRFPGGVNTISQTGAHLSPMREGVNVDLIYPILADGRPAPVPRCAEVYSDDQHEYAEIGLMFGGEDGAPIQLEDYDGCFSLPREVIVALEFDGFTVGEDFKADARDPQSEPAHLHSRHDGRDERRQMGIQA